MNKDYKVKSELLVQSDRKVFKVKLALLVQLVLPDHKVFKASKDYKVKLVP